MNPSKASLAAVLAISSMMDMDMAGPKLIKRNTRNTRNTRKPHKIRNTSKEQQRRLRQMAKES